MKLGKNNSKSRKKSKTLNKPNVYWTKECAEMYTENKCTSPCVKVRTKSVLFGRYKCVPDKKLVKLHKTKLRNKSKVRKPIRIQKKLKKEEKLRIQKLEDAKLAKERAPKNPDLGFAANLTMAGITGYYWARSTLAASHFFNSLIFKRANNSIKWLDLSIDKKILFIIFIIIESNEKFMKNKIVEKSYLIKPNHNFSKLDLFNFGVLIMELLKVKEVPLSNTINYLEELFNDNLTTLGRSLGLFIGVNYIFK